MFWGVFLLAFLPAISGECLKHDSKPPKCEEWIGPHDEPVFIEHAYNCSRFWVCNPDLSDCLFECAPMDNTGALYFDVRYQYPLGPVCDWPSNIDCDNRPNDCGECEVWQDCVETEDGFICIPDCHIDPHCEDDEYCDYPDGGEGDCHEGCRNGDVCGVNTRPCGICTDHVCQEPECCTDEDCEENEMCNNGKCELSGCIEDSDCTNTTCSTCNANHECFDPECCTDKDCKNPSEPVCSDDHVCVECVEDDDCDDPSNPICSEDNVCIPGCHDHDNCDGYDQTCNEGYTNCNYCDKPQDSDHGDCEPGCVDDDNCAGDQICNGEHRCTQKGTSNNLKTISLTTDQCTGCAGTNQEQGLVLDLNGGVNTDGETYCKTSNLDHPNEIDYANNHQVTFGDKDDETDRNSLGACYRANLQGEISGGKVTWTAGKGKWSLKNNQIDFGWSDEKACTWSCCMDATPLEPGDTRNLKNCARNCKNGDICN